MAESLMCTVDGCENPSRAKKQAGLCGPHRQRQRTGKPLDAPFRPRIRPEDNHGPCEVEGCDAPRQLRGFCNLHYRRWRRYGDPLGGRRSAGAPAEPCTVEGCDRDAESRGMCATHYHRVRRSGDPGEVEGRRVPRGDRCAVEGCERSPIAKALCSLHYERVRRGLDPGPAHKLIEHTPQAGLTCRGPECDRPAIARGCCSGHYHQMLAGKELAPLLRYGLDEPQGPGFLKNGYRILSVGGRHIAEHRYLMQKLLGRELGPHENVHHINGVRDDNSTDGPLTLDPATGRLRSGNLELWSTSQPPGQDIAAKVEWAREFIELYGDAVGG